MVSRARSLLDRYRRHGAKALLAQARTAAAQLLTPVPASPVAKAPPSPFQDTPQPASPPPRIGDDVLAGMCAGIAVRDLNLVDSLLAMLEQMEVDEDDPDTLARLYRLDHLATRLRRNAENLRVLAGQEAGSATEETTSLIDVIRAAMSSIEQYTRIEIGRVAGLAVAGFAADDVSRLVAELLDNAAAQSPPNSTVTVSAHITEQGSVLLRVEDAGIGLPAERIAVLNKRLISAPRLDSDSIEHMGLAVVRSLARKHQIKVWLGRRAPHGTTASVLLRTELVRETAPAVWVKPAEAPSKAAPRPAMPAPRSAGSPPSEVTASGLPRRLPAGRRAEAPVPAASAVRREEEETTTSGLPRRISRSLRAEGRPEESASRNPQAVSSRAESQARAGRAQLVSDLGAFADGEQAARASRSGEEEQKRDGKALHDD
ncbi:sensor histidine kinase [Actinoalloteichus hoggarensis]|uniref:histidine kinase n=1 Tax=Actinoalloteichus hoggarensis TaxID=1470176 RepID=A0A221W3B1_9PSEU|nr:ATP-binding protein [Actinoalloteichus hoggarensis]ASO20224.1 Adaptive-response sensory-kinase SasA [Actinoalloteichus hoggarensis]